MSRFLFEFFIDEFLESFSQAKRLILDKGDSIDLPYVVIALSELLSSRAQFLTICK
jgi:hypothetical protein